MKKIKKYINMLLFKCSLYFNNRTRNKDPIISLIDELEYLIKNDSLVNPYLCKYKITSIHRDILVYTDALNAILLQDMTSGYIKITQINEQMLLTLHIGLFWTDDGKLLPDTSLVFLKWLQATREIVIRYNLNIRLVGSGLPYSNAIKIQPYITNIKHILESILNNLKS